ncbi:efflux RND transporter permease subunit [Kordiimonas sp.]|uniref:efflux RND transporter permease subunit n=1 Tax=Kordiimonas sp. TaxID=1970157 RepID=UPI003B529632
MKAAGLVVAGRWLVLALALMASVLAMSAAGTLKVSTKLEALMPEDAPSVITLNDAMEKIGSFAAIQVIVESDDPRRAEEGLFILEAITRRLPWTDSAQYFEDISVLERHKLLQLDVAELEQVEARLEEEILANVTRNIEKSTGIPLTISLVGQDIRVSSREKKGVPASELLAPMETERRFASDDGRSQALVIWPKAGYQGLAGAKTMIGDIAAIIQALELNASGSGLKVGIAGRVRNKVAQFDAVMHDVKIGLGSSVSLIMLLLLLHYRRLMALPLIIIPLAFGIIWTIGLTAVVIGGLNLITIFLALILFGLGIDFGIHNFSRYAEARGLGDSHREAIAVLLAHTGRASLIAGITTAAGFLALLLTEFRAFREFGFIAGSGMLLIYLSMYTVFPALLSVMAPFMTWRPSGVAGSGVMGGRFALGPRRALGLFLPPLVAAGFLVPHLSFERNFKNIQAAQSAEHQWATERSKRIFKGGHDRAVLVVDTLEEVKAIEDYFEAYNRKDTRTPTVAKITSVRNFVPDREGQAARLEVINRMWSKIEESGPLPISLQDKAKYLQIGMLDVKDLPQGMRRVFLGNERKPGYLVYIYNSVTMNDADLARQFYDDVASFTVDGKTYHPASEGFIFVEMLALMKADAIKAVLLVGLVTLAAVAGFCRSLKATCVILAPTAFGLILTLGIMALVGLKLSIINMVILPSLIGISVDNAIHIVERFTEGRDEVRTVMATTGRAAIVTTFTTLLGFGGLITASMGGLRSMGYLALIGFGMCLLMTWVLLPVLLQLLQSAKQRKTVYG